MLKNLYHWFTASLPIHILIIICWLFGSSLISTDLNVLLLQYVLAVAISLVSIPLIKSIKNSIGIFKVLFLVMLLVNVLLSVFFPFFRFIESIRPLMLFLFLASAFPVVYMARTNSDTLNTDEYNFNFKALSINNKLTYGLLFVIIAIAIFVRFYGLDTLPSYRDEDHHIQAVWQMLNEGFHDYKRGWIVTHLGALFIKLSNAVSYDSYLYWGRFPSAIMGSLVTIPIFLLGKKVGNLTALVSAFLWATSPWAIGISQNFREHIYYVFLISLMTYLLIQCLDWIFNFEKKNIPKIILAGSAIGAIIAYALFDWFSTLKISGAILAVVTIMYIFTNLIEIVQKNPLLRKFLPFFGVLAGLFFIPITQIKFFKLVDTPNVRWADTFLSPQAQTPNHWWNDFSADPYLAYLLISLASIAVLFFKSRNYWWIYFTTFFSLLFGYTFFFDRYYAPRYIVFIYPFFILLVAAGFSGVYQNARIILKSLKLPNWLANSLPIVITILLLTLIKPKLIEDAIFSPKILATQQVSTTGIVHYDKAPAIQFINQIPAEERIDLPIITSIYGESLRHEVDSLGSTYKYQYKAPDRVKFVQEIMNQNYRGYLILDKMRNGLWQKGYSQNIYETNQYNNTQLTLVKVDSLCQIYEWVTDINLQSDSLIVAASSLQTQLEDLDIGGPLVLRFAVEADALVNAPFLLIGDDPEKGISFVPSLDKKGFIVSFGSNVSGKDAIEIPFDETRQGLNSIEYYQYGGTKGSTYGLLLNDEIVLTDKLPVHKSGTYNVYTNIQFQGSVVGINSDVKIDKRRYIIKK